MTFKEFQAFTYLNEDRLKLKNRIRMINGLSRAIRKINGFEMPYCKIDELEITPYLLLPMKQMKHWHQMGPVTIKELKRAHKAYLKQKVA